MHPSTQHKVQQLVQELQHLFETQLVSVCVYGSAVFQTGEPPRHDLGHNINVLVILQAITPGLLDRASSIAKWWQKEAHSIPVFLSQAEWDASHDIFALEYADIRDHHVVVHGADLYTGGPVDRQALRLVCELELSRKLMFLRQRLLIHRDKPEALLEVLTQVISSITAVGRAIVRLRSPEPPPQEVRACFEALGKGIPGLEVRPFIRVYEAKHGWNPIRPNDVLHVYGQCLQSLAVLVADLNLPAHSQEGVPA